MKQEGIIEFKLEGISFEQTEKYREVLHLLLISGALNINTGKTILHWNNNALQAIETDVHLWRRDRNSPPLTETRVVIEPKRTTQTFTQGGIR